MMPYHGNFRFLPPNNRRKSKEGDWICIRCNNYNYAFRQLCTCLPLFLGNRCRYQTKIDNDQAMALLGKENYGENSFPRALFLAFE
jgi:hypothetical protein